MFGLGSHQTVQVLYSPIEQFIWGVISGTCWWSFLPRITTHFGTGKHPIGLLDASISWNALSSSLFDTLKQMENSFKVLKWLPKSSHLSPFDEIWSNIEGTICLQRRQPKKAEVKTVGLGWVDMGAKEWAAVVLERYNRQYHSQVAFYCSCKWRTKRDIKGIIHRTFCLFVFHCTT